MWISEVFESVQGEGRYSGVPSGFIRTSGCNLRCWFCDTPYTSWHPEGVERSLESLLEETASYTARHMVLTGGEPLLIPDIVPLSQSLRDRGCVITIETAGTVYRKTAADLISISPKRANSTPRGTSWEARHDQRRHRPDVIRQLTTEYDYQFKFVIDQPADLDDVESYLREFPHLQPDKIYLMPQGTQMESLREKLTWIRTEAEKRGWQVSPRLHIELFGNTRGT
ncbi:7-carboxy-7-deazaguanine synthase QueE [Planctomicrobium sp. SH661]|uniref:7-carboxy-7-deazaguanine synthase QueE n=1 Tax=Planctomicrobium sp. SH661 TaxID=3448124 RepID=UPI003F5BF32A